MNKEPIFQKSRDGIYPRCVFCGVELPACAVWDYSKNGAIPSCCSLPLPDSYKKESVKELVEEVKLWDLI